MFTLHPTAGIHPAGIHPAGPTGEMSLRTMKSYGTIDSQEEISVQPAPRVSRKVSCTAAWKTRRQKHPPPIRSQPPIYRPASNLRHDCCVHGLGAVHEQRTAARQRGPICGVYAVEGVRREGDELFCAREGCELVLNATASGLALPDSTVANAGTHVTRSRPSHPLYSSRRASRTTWVTMVCMCPRLIPTRLGQQELCW